MRAEIETWTVVLSAVWAASVGVRAEEPAAALVAVAPEIVLKRPDPALVVFLEHTGPYWTVGPLFRQVRELMLAHNEVGPMFARYASDPTTVTPEALRTRVGFVASGEWTPEPPFRSAEFEGEQVAAMVVDGSYGTTTRYYSVMRDWLSTHGFEPVGPVIELYPPAPSGAPTGTQRTEIQMPVRQARASELPRARNVVSEGSGSEHPREASQGSGEGTRIQTASSGDEGRESPAMDAGAVQPNTVYEPVRSVRELIEESRFDRLAEQLIPRDSPTSATLQVWLGQVVFRVSAVAKGIEQTYHDGSPQIMALSTAFARRYRQVSGSSTVNALDSAVVRVDMRSDPHSARRRAIMLELDTLLGHVALKTVDADAGLNRLIDILQRVQDLTSSAPR